MRGPWLKKCQWPIGIALSVNQCVEGVYQICTGCRYQSVRCPSHGFISKLNKIDPHLLWNTVRKLTPLILCTYSDRPQTSPGVGQNLPSWEAQLQVFFMTVSILLFNIDRIASILYVWLVPQFLKTVLPYQWCLFIEACCCHISFSQFVFKWCVWKSCCIYDMIQYNIE